MLANKHLGKVVAVVMIVAVLLCFYGIIFYNDLAVFMGDSRLRMEYESKLFSTNEIISLNIVMDENEWNEMLGNAMSEEYYKCDVEINGELFKNVGIRPKGNTSLSSIANDPDTNRYSFKIEFDQYDSNQNCYGLDKLVLNNNYADNTNMKEALIYDMYKFVGADAPLYNYAKISVNDEYWGVYLALEAVEESFMIRNYGALKGELYKPDGMNMGGGKKKDDNKTKTEKGGGFGGFGGFGGGGGSNLNYSSSNPESYSTIWNGAVTDIEDADKERVVTALKNISEGTDLENYMDIDNLVKYMAVHIFSVNQDSLSGNMAHNYYLYESGGKLNIIPWDYNLALGGMQGGNASSVINDAIDMPFSSTKFFDKLLENDKYKQLYYKYLELLTDKYVNGGGLDAFYERTRKQIDSLVKTDPNSFVTYESYETAADVLYEAITLRAKSIKGQVSGTIPSTAEEQRTNSENLVDASHLNLNLLGSMRGGDRLREQTNGTETKSGKGE